MQARDDLALLIEAAREAGRIAGKYWTKSPEVIEKPNGEGPVTQADLEIDKMLRASLMAARPGYGWLSEETPDTSARLKDDTVFIVDPIDGTRAFIDGSRGFSHSLAVARDGQVTAAVVFLPMHERMFTATRGGGAALNDTPLVASTASDETRADILTTKPNLLETHWPGGVPGFNRHFRSSLAYRLALVGQGRFDGMVTFRNSWEWDIAAGSLIAAEAGATVSDRHGHALRFNNAEPMLPGVLAASPQIHARFMARVLPAA